MKKSDIIRAWKNPEYRDSLGEAERNAAGPNPAGLSTLTSDQLREVFGGGAGTNNSCCGNRSMNSCCKMF